MTENTTGGPQGSSHGTAESPSHDPRHDPGPRVTSDEVRDLSRLRRSSTDRHVAGVAGGLARHLDVDPVLLRVAFVVLTFFGGAGLLVYAACWVFVPMDDGRPAPIDLDQRTRGILLIGVGVLAVLAVLGDLTGGPDFWFPLPLILIGLLVWWILSRHDRRDRRDAHQAYAAVGAAAGHPGSTATPSAEGSAPPPGTPGSAHGPWGPESLPPAPPRRPRDPRKRGPILFWFTLGLIAVALGTLGIVDGAGVDIVDSAYPAVILAVIALMLLVGSVYGRAGGLILLGVLATGALSLATAADRWDGEHREVTPLSAGQLQDDYDMDTGEFVLDLTAIDPELLDGRQVRIDGGAGRIEVVVPSGVDVRAEGEVGGPGAIDLFGEEHGGISIHNQEFHEGGQDVPLLEIDAHLGIGEIEVRTR